MKIDGPHLCGPPTMDGRVPTFGFTIAGHEPAAVTRHLADRGIFAWSGHFCAVESICALGVVESGGLVRIGLCHYNTEDEVDAMLDSMTNLTRAN